MLKNLYKPRATVLSSTSFTTTSNFVLKRVAYFWIQPHSFSKTKFPQHLLFVVCCRYIYFFRLWEGMRLCIYICVCFVFSEEQSPQNCCCGMCYAVVTWGSRRRLLRHEDHSDQHAVSWNNETSNIFLWDLVNSMSMRFPL